MKALMTEQMIEQSVLANDGVKECWWSKCQIDRRHVEEMNHKITMQVWLVKGRGVRYNERDPKNIFERRIC